MGMRLNLGCGDRYVGGWHNVDHDDCPFPVDERVDLTRPLPWERGSIELVYAGHVLEHLEQWDAARLLGQLRPCMISGGQIMVVGPDAALARSLEHAGAFDYSHGHTPAQIEHGACRWPGDEHRWECSAAKTVMMLIDAGWREVLGPLDHIPDEWPVADRRPSWQFAVSAVAL
jgi:hypothetical protein